MISKMSRPTIIVIGVLVGTLAVTIFNPLTFLYLSTDQVHIAVNGRNLTLDKVKSLEQKLKTNEKDINTRLQLLGYYFNKQSDSSSHKDEYNKHALWLIQYYPEEKIHSSPLTCILNRESPTEYDKGMKLWLKHLQAKPKNLTIINHAAEFFLMADMALAQNLYLEAEKADPENDEWSGKLGYLYSLAIKASSGDARKKVALKSLAAYRRAYNKIPVELLRHDYYIEAAKVAIIAGELQAAEEYATKTLEFAKKTPRQDDHLHNSNTVLGLVALEKGDVATAKQRLLDSAKVNGSPVLGSFGPSMKLADRLLKKGEKATVLEYLKLCSKFWEGTRVTKWIEEVEKGKTPDFSRSIR